MKTPTVILLGSKPGATVALELMLKNGWDVKAVVPSATHAFLKGDTVDDVAVRHAINIFTQEDLPDVRVDFVISYMFRKKVIPRTLSLASRAALNFHAGPLPEYGGWAFYNVAILENVNEYGCTCHHMDDNFDSGPLLKVRRFGIDAAQETAYSLERRAQLEMILLFKDFMTLVDRGEALPKIPQERNQMRYMKKNDFDALKRIPSDVGYDDIQRTARAFFYPPYECAYLEVGGKRVEVLPDLVKDVLAEKLHEDDLAKLREAANLTS